MQIWQHQIPVFAVHRDDDGQLLAPDQRSGWRLMGEFRQLGFQEQVDAVASDLQISFWNTGARVIANSFGAYLFLNAQAQLPPHPGKGILLSPIVSQFANQETKMNFISPRSELLLAASLQCNYWAFQWRKPMSCI
jgi:hypothetical protein